MPLDFSNALEFLGLLTVATLCSSVIGYDRERKNRPAGLRTHIIVCVSSTLVMYVGIKLKDQYLTSSPNVDPARMAAQILSGIGFLGAGTIIKGKDNVHGLTTAATLWSVACLGIAVGAGFIFEGIAITLAVLLVLRVVSKLEKTLIVNRRTFDMVISFASPSSNLKEIGRILESNKYRMISSEILYDKELSETEDTIITAHVIARSIASDLKAQSQPDEILERFSFIRQIDIAPN